MRYNVTIVALVWLFDLFQRIGIKRRYQGCNPVYDLATSSIDSGSAYHHSAISVSDTYELPVHTTSSSAHFEFTAFQPAIGDHRFEDESRHYNPFGKSWLPEIYTVP